MSADPYITPGDVSLISQRTLEACFTNQELAMDMDREDVIKHNRDLCAQRIRIYMHDNPQLFVEHFKQANS